MEKRIIRLSDMKKVINDKSIIVPSEIRFSTKAKRLDRITVSQEKTKKVLEY